MEDLIPQISFSRQFRMTLYGSSILVLYPVHGPSPRKLEVPHDEGNVTANQAANPLYINS
jgi:hypothetical protein